MDIIKQMFHNKFDDEYLERRINDCQFYFIDWHLLRHLKTVMCEEHLVPITINSRAHQQWDQDSNMYTTIKLCRVFHKLIRMLSNMIAALCFIILLRVWFIDELHSSFEFLWTFEISVKLQWNFSEISWKYQKQKSLQFQWNFTEISLKFKIIISNINNK